MDVNPVVENRFEDVDALVRRTRAEARARGAGPAASGPRK
jgi:hypothetical protein